MVCRKQVSIIIPVYNAEGYLRKCIDSVLNQTYRDIEVILVNDGSIDSSGMICDQYKKIDNRVKVIHQKNSGPSATRNRGIEAAIGEYIQFVDSDDTIEFNATQKLVEAAKGDIQFVICGYKSIERNGHNQIMQDHIPFIEGIYTKNEFIQYVGELIEKGFFNPLWNKLFNTKILKEFNIQFIENLNMGEDLLFNIQYYKVCRNIKIIPDSLYQYLILNNQDSLTGKFMKDLFENQKFLFHKVRELLIETNDYNENNKHYLETAYIDSLIGCFDNFYHKDSNLTSNQIKSEMKTIIFDHSVRNDIQYFLHGSTQERITGYLIQRNSIKGLYIFYKVKNNLRNNLQPIFQYLKRVNREARGRF